MYKGQCLANYYQCCAPLGVAALGQRVESTENVQKLTSLTACEHGLMCWHKH